MAAECRIQDYKRSGGGEACWERGIESRVPGLREILAHHALPAIPTPIPASTIDTEMMTASPATCETPPPVPAPRLLVELPSRSGVFLSNLRDIVAPRRLPPLELESAPAPFWHDVFVKRGLPWRAFLDSGACHLIACGLLIGLSRLIALQPQVVAKPAFDHDDVIYYHAEEYLPPLDTRTARESQPSQADPELSRQPIISVPAEADNRSQTVVAPPSVKLKRDVALPNIVAWSDKAERPQLEIPAAPLTLAADLSRIAPRVERSVVAAPPDAAHFTNRRQQRTLQSAVVAPPAELKDVRQSPALQSPIDVTPPPPSVQAATARPIRDLNIARSPVIAPAPQLAVSEQRTVAPRRGSAIGGVASAVVAPPPSLSASGSSGASFGARGHVIALNLHPVVGAPPNPPPGNRRGTFAATPEGHSGASGAVGSTGAAVSSADGRGNKNGKETGNVSNRKGSSDLPAGLYVGSAGAKTSAVAGDAAGKTVAVNSASAKPAASAPSPPATIPSHPAQTESAGKLSAAEKEVFGSRKFYSLTLNMPNLNSAGGSWVIRFAELNHDSGLGPNHDAPAADLSQPAATKKVDPAYPLQLMRQNVAGTVILYAIIHADGAVGSVRVLRGVDDRLDQYASQAIEQWKFQPATKNGAPVDVEATFQIPFKPGRVGTNF
jgi:TonB family protein